MRQRNRIKASLALSGWNRWRQSRTIEVTEVEESRLLRSLVQALVIVGIIATDVAAETQFSLWAVPLSIVGAFWSWYRRHDRNISTKFCIAIAMCYALAAFFGRLLGELNDTRVLLAELLIQLQVCHSFDLPRRKDLGYSIVVGLILLAVAGTLSQTLAFAPMLLLFLAIALPVLVLDYRSRLGIEERGAKNNGQEVKKFSFVTFKSTGILFLVTLGLGLTVFAVLPRFPGYQLRTFPVSAPIDIQENFDGRSIVNPGYVREGSGRGTNGGSGSDAQGGTSVDETFYYGFNSEINQNLRGEMKPKVVMRVRSQVEGFWRVLGFDRYTGQGWEISRNEQVVNLKRPTWSYQIFLSPPAIALSTREVVQTYTVVSELPNLIPALAYPKQIFFPAPEIAVDPEGGLRSPVGLSKDLTYTVISQIPYRDRTLLGQASTNYPKNIRNYYLQIPPEIAAQVRQLTQEILANYNQQRVGQSEKALTSPYEQALYLAQYLKQNYTIPENPLALPYLAENEDLVTAFLFKHKGGYPDHFSTVLTIMLRSIGIPARLTVGFSPGEFNPFTGLYIVRNTDAYALTEVYFPEYGWFAFDPIPGHPLIPPSVEEAQTFSVLQKFWQWVAGWLPSPVSGFLNTLFAIVLDGITAAIAWFIALFSQGWFGILTALIVATGISFLIWLGLQQWQIWRRQRTLAKLHPIERLYQQMLDWTATQGLRKHAAQTPLEYAQISHQHYPTSVAKVIEEICQAYMSWRYGGQLPDVEELTMQWHTLKKYQLSDKKIFRA
ncbi:transglutaminase [Chroococcidiopsis sp. TS-821]|nr:transglutaminase [Chroococcidiopsis sp. TS-821]